MEVFECVSNLLDQGNALLFIKDLKVKGTSVQLKQGTKSNTSTSRKVEMSSREVRGNGRCLRLKISFLKKA